MAILQEGLAVEKQVACWLGDARCSADHHALQRWLPLLGLKACNENSYSIVHACTW